MDAPHYVKLGHTQYTQLQKKLHTSISDVYVLEI